MKCTLFLFSVLFWINYAVAQSYTTGNAHSHNDYEQIAPFYAAWKSGFGSIEVDVFLEKDELIIAHDYSQVKNSRKLDMLYLQPLHNCIEKNKGSVYADATKLLVLLVDIKSAPVPALQKLVEKLKRYPMLISCPSLRIVISGNRPPPAQYAEWPQWIHFDGEIGTNYTPAQWERIGLLSGNFAKYSTWNGKGRISEKEKKEMEQLISNAHSHGKKIRFWNAPDMLNSWYAFMDLGIDYINTDHIEAMSSFLQQLPDRTYTHPQPHTLYTPQWRNDGVDKKVKNIILIIGDGTGIAQWYAGYTANRGALNVFNMKHAGVSKTSSFDNYITDSAPGATAFSAGTKTNNRSVGVDHTGAKLELLPVILRKHNMKTAILTSGDFRDATPAAFYAHQPERSNFKEILNDLYADPVDILMGACDNVKDSLTGLLQSKIDVHFSLAGLPQSPIRPFVVADTLAAKPVAEGRGNWSERAMVKAFDILDKHAGGFFMMMEGAQIDHGGHANKLPYVVSELLDLDKVIGRAMQFADTNGETLVIVTGDHETGGLSLTGGDYQKGFISGQFSTQDHTAVPVPVFAYGPKSYLFEGTYENTEIFNKILKAVF